MKRDWEEEAKKGRKSFGGRPEGGGGEGEKWNDFLSFSPPPPTKPKSARLEPRPAQPLPSSSLPLPPKSESNFHHSQKLAG